MKYSQQLRPLSFLAAFSLFACEINREKQNSPGGPNPTYPSRGTAPDGTTGSTRDALPANGAAETGQGVTNSDTSAASGAVDQSGQQQPAEGVRSDSEQTAPGNARP